MFFFVVIYSKLQPVSFDYLHKCYCKNLLDISSWVHCMQRFSPTAYCDLLQYEHDLLSFSNLSKYQIY